MPPATGVIMASLQGRRRLGGQRPGPQARWLLRYRRALQHHAFAYITGVLPGGERGPLFRLRYGGSAHSFGFAIYSAARDR